MQFPFITYGMALYRVAQKERNGTTSGNKDIQWLVSVDGLSSPEINAVPFFPS